MKPAVLQPAALLLTILAAAATASTRQAATSSAGRSPSMAPQLLVAPSSRPKAPSTVACDRWDTLLQGLQSFYLTTTNPDVAAGIAKSNLEAVKPTHDTVETGGACLESRIPRLADPKYVQKFYRFEKGSLWMQSGLGFLAKLDKRSLINMFSQYRDLKLFRPDSDAALVAATSFRESSSLAWVSSNTVVDTHVSGGLDFLGASLSMVRARYLPPGYGASWGQGRHAPNESGDMSWAATLPQHDLPVAYGAWLLFAKDEFDAAAKKRGFTQADLDAMSVDARRAWTGLFFAAAGGVDFDKPHANSAAQIGGLTVLSQLVATMAKNKAHGLEDRGLEILTSATLYKYTDVRLAMAAAANAALLERFLGFQ